jgi:hypothetical protein
MIALATCTGTHPEPVPSPKTPSPRERKRTKQDQKTQAHLAKARVFCLQKIRVVSGMLWKGSETEEARSRR